MDVGVDFKRFERLQRTGGAGKVREVPNGFSNPKINWVRWCKWAHDSRVAVQLDR